MVDAAKLDFDATEKNFEQYWDNWYVQGLCDFIRVPNLTPMVDPDYATNGLVQEAMKLVDDYINKIEIKGMTKHQFHPEGMNPLIVYVVDKTEGASDKQCMFYGHLDKQPWMEGWAEGLGPTNPVIRGDYLYGRGGGDDGYAPFTCMLAIKNAQMQGIPHPRCALVLETEEESGSPNLINLLQHAKDVIGDPDYMFCLDAGAFDYSKLWLTSSLRGISLHDITVSAAKGGYHSGEVGGVVPETFRVCRELLNRLDDPLTGKVCDELHTQLPDYAYPEAKAMADVAGDSICTKYKMVEGVKYCQDDLAEAYLAQTWRPNLSVTGAGGLPHYQSAGNVVRASTSLRLSMRLPPNMDCKVASKVIREKLMTDVPYNCKVEVHSDHDGNGWCMKTPKDWESEILSECSKRFFDGKDWGSCGLGGSIPFLARLGELYPKCNIIALGVLGPNSNAHAPNESIHLPFTKKLTMAISHMVTGIGAHE